MNLLSISGWIIGAIALLFAIWSHYNNSQKSKKSVVYRLSSFTPLNSLDDDMGSDIKIMRQGQEITNAVFLDIVFKNTGADISRNDFGEPLEVVFDDEAKIIKLVGASADDVRFEPQDNSEHGQGENKILIPEFVLNKGCEFNLKVLGESIETVEVKSDISGIQKIEEARHADLDSPDINSAGISPIILLIATTATFITLFISLTGFSNFADLRRALVPNSGTSYIELSVFDDETGEPIEYARVILSTGTESISDFSDSQGRLRVDKRIFSLRGDMLIEVSQKGYQRHYAIISLLPQGDNLVDVPLVPE